MRKIRRASHSTTRMNNVLIDESLTSVRAKCECEEKGKMYLKKRKMK